MVGKKCFKKNIIKVFSLLDGDLMNNKQGAENPVNYYDFSKFIGHKGEIETGLWSPLTEAFKAIT